MSKLLAVLLLSSPLASLAADAEPLGGSVTAGVPAQPVAAQADDDAPFRPTTSGPLVSFTAPMTPEGRLVLQPVMTWTQARGAFDAQAHRTARGPGESGHVLATTVFAEAGVAERLSVGGQVAVSHAQATAGAQSAESVGLSDALLFGRVLAHAERASTPWPETTVVGMVKLPTGRAVAARPETLDTDVTGTGTVDLSLGLGFTRGLDPVLLHADLFGVAALPADVGGTRVSPGAALLWSGSMEWPFARKLALMVELSGKLQGAGKEDGVRVEDGSVAEVASGLGLEFIATDDVQLLVGWQRTLWGRNTAAVDTFTFSVVPVLF